MGSRGELRQLLGARMYWGGAQESQKFLDTMRGYVLLLLPRVPGKAKEWFSARNPSPYQPSSVWSCPSPDSMYPVFFPLQEINEIYPCASTWKDVYFPSQVVKPWKGRLDIQDPGSNPEGGHILKLMQLWFHFGWLRKEKASANSEEYQAKVTILRLYNTGSSQTLIFTQWVCVGVVRTEG